MREQPGRVLLRFLDPARGPQINLIYTVVIAIISNAAYELLKDRFATGGALVISSVIFILLVVFAWLPRRFWEQARAVLVPGSAVVGRRAGLITPVSQGQSIQRTPAFTAIMYHLDRLRHVWLICSVPPQEAPTTFKSSAALARELQDHFQKLKPGLRVHILEVADPDDPIDVYKQAVLAYASAKLEKIPRDDLIADVTGGTVSMSLGLTFAGQSDEYVFEYLKPNGYKEDGSTNFAAGSTPREIDVRY